MDWGLAFLTFFGIIGIAIAVTLWFNGLLWVGDEFEDKFGRGGLAAFFYVVVTFALLLALSAGLGI